MDPLISKVMINLSVVMLCHPLTSFSICVGATGDG